MPPKELLESVERGEWKSAGSGKRERATEPVVPLRESEVPQGRRLNVRLSSNDLEALQKRAEGLSFQTLISSLMHKHAGRVLPAAVDHRLSAYREGWPERQLLSSIVEMPRTFA